MAYPQLDTNEQCIGFVKGVPYGWRRGFATGVALTSVVAALLWYFVF